MDQCLGCMACMTACPSGVQYDKLIEDSRSQVERNIPRTTADSLFRKLLFATFPYPRRLRLIAGPLFLYQRSGLQSLVRASGLLKLLPERFAAMEAVLPTVPAHFTWTMPERVSSVAPTRGRVGMLTGCVQQVFFSHVNAATARVLSAEGFEVIIPASQPCCGALMVHSGLEDQAAAMARNLIALFEAANVDTIVINAAGCGSTMKEYGHLLRDDPQWAARARAFSAKCRDITEILCSVPSVALRHPLPVRVAYHDACHLRHAQGIYQQPRQLLCRNSPARSGRDCRGLSLLWLRWRLQPPPARARPAAWRPQSQPSPRHSLSSSRLRQPRLSSSTDERPPPSRRAHPARLSHGRAPRRLHPRPHRSTNSSAVKRVFTSRLSLQRRETCTQRSIAQAPRRPMNYPG